MNLYEVSVDNWTVRTKASSFKTAIGNALRPGGRMAKELRLRSTTRGRLDVTAKVIIRGIPRDYEVPDFKTSTETIRANFEAERQAA